jgi:hypothetical protein
MQSQHGNLTLVILPSHVNAQTSLFHYLLSAKLLQCGEAAATGNVTRAEDQMPAAIPRLRL